MEKSNKVIVRIAIPRWKDEVIFYHYFTLTRVTNASHSMNLLGTVYFRQHTLHFHYSVFSICVFFLSHSEGVKALCSSKLLDIIIRLEFSVQYVGQIL